MPSSITTVISPAAERKELPSWMTLYALLVATLRRWGLLDAVGEIHLARRAASYCLLDVVLFLLAYFCWRGPGGLRGLSQQCRDQGWGPHLAAVGGRASWATSAAVSRVLARVGPPALRAFRGQILGGGAAHSRLPLHPLGQYRDAHGQAWTVFDLDDVVKASRERALPAAADLPSPQRRSSAMGAPGYHGRKRGEKQISSHRLQQAGSGLWVGQESVAGNGQMAEAAAEACAWLAAWCARCELDRDHVVIRVDGAGGNEPCARAVRSAGFRLVARTACYDVLEQEPMRAYLRGAVFYPVPSSQSGPVRHAAELGAALAGACASAPTMRLLATRFTSAKPGKKAGAGYLLGPAQYELFVTDLDGSAWPVEDAVALYFGRAATENSYHRANEELGLKRTFCIHRPGQDLAVLVGMLAWNLEAELGAQLVGLGQEHLPQEQRGARVPCAFDDLPPAASHSLPPSEAAPVLAESPVVSPVLGAPPPSTPAPIAHDPSATAYAVATLSVAPLAMPAGDDSPPPGSTNESPATTQPPATPWSELQAAFADRPTWHLDPADGLRCPNGHRLRLHRQQTTPSGATRVTFRSREGACATCPRRSDCTSGTAKHFVKEVCATVPGALPKLAFLSFTALLPAVTHAVAASLRPVDAAAPGPYQPLHPALVPSALRRVLELACQQVQLHVHLPPGAQDRRPSPRYIAPTAACRQHRRRTYAERLSWNASRATHPAVLEFIGGDELRPVLPDGESPGLAA